MPKITLIKPQKSNKRVNVFLDGEFAFGLSLEVFMKKGLKVNDQLTGIQVKKILKEELGQKYFNLVLRFLSYRPRSETEVRNYLQRKFRKNKVVGPDSGRKMIEMMVAALKKRKLLNDREFVSWWIEQRAAFRPTGKRGLMVELRQKGIDPKLSRPIIEAEVDESQLVWKAIEKKIRTWRRLNRFVLEKKLSAFLSRRGFAWPVIKEVLDEIDKKR